MRVSELNLQNVAQAVRENPDFLTEDEKAYIESLIIASRHFAMSYTGLSEEEMDSHEDITVAVLNLIADMYDNRQYNVDNTSVNRVADTILGMYSVNLL